MVQIVRCDRLKATHTCHHSIGSERLLHDRQRALVERLGLGVLTLGLIERRQVVETDGYVRVVGAEGGLFAAQELGIPCLLSMDMAVPCLSSSLSTDLGDNPAGQCLLLEVKRTFQTRPQRVR